MHQWLLSCHTSGSETHAICEPCSMMLLVVIVGLMIRRLILSKGSQIADRTAISLHLLWWRLPLAIGTQGTCRLLSPVCMPGVGISNMFSPGVHKTASSLAGSARVQLVECTHREGCRAMPLQQLSCIFVMQAAFVFACLCANCFVDVAACSFLILHGTGAVQVLGVHVILLAFGHALV